MFEVEQSITIGPDPLVLWGDGTTFNVKSKEQGMRSYLVSRRPIHQPVSWNGFMVMNTEDKLRTAFEELWKGY